MSAVQFHWPASVSPIKRRDGSVWRHLRMSVTLGLLLLCTACGFQLRADLDLPPEMTKTYMVINDQYGILARRVRVLLEQSGATFVGSKDATALLEIPTNNVVTEVLTVSDNARVREFRISYTVKFRVVAADGREIIPLQTIRQAREISFDEQQILAASREQEYLKQDLAETLARMLVTRLGTSDSSSPQGSGHGR